MTLAPAPLAPEPPHPFPFPVHPDPIADASIIACATLRTGVPPIDLDEPRIRRTMHVLVTSIARTDDESEKTIARVNRAIDQLAGQLRACLLAEALDMPTADESARDPRHDAPSDWPGDDGGARVPRPTTPIAPAPMTTVDPHPAPTAEDHLSAMKQSIVSTLGTMPAWDDEL